MRDRRQVASRTSCAIRPALSSRPCRVGSDPWRSSSPSSSRPGAREATTPPARPRAPAPKRARPPPRAARRSPCALEAPTPVPGCSRCRSSTARTESRPASSSAPPGTRPVTRGLRRSARGHTASRNDPAPRAAPVGAAVESPDSPGWATVGTSRDSGARDPAERLRLGPGRREDHLSRDLAPSHRRLGAGVGTRSRSPGPVATRVRAGRTRRPPASRPGARGSGPEEDEISEHGGARPRPHPRAPGELSVIGPRTRTVPSKVVKTTSFETVAQPKLGDGSRRTQARPVAASRATSRPFPSMGRRSSAPGGRWRSPTRTGRRRGRTTGPPRRPSASRLRRTGRGRRSRGGAAAGRGRCGADRQPWPTAAVASRGPRRSPARPCRLRGRVPFLDRRQDRSSPRSRSRGRRAASWSCQSSRPLRASSTSSEFVYGTGPGKAAPFGRSAIRPTAPGSSSPRRAGLARRPRPGTRAHHRRPRAGTARVPDRVELPAHHSGRGVERVDRASPARREADGAREDQPFPDDRRDVDELLRRARQVPAPQLTARRGGERERVGVGRAVDPPAVHGEPVRPFVQRAVAVHPAQLPGRARARGRCSGGPGRKPSRGLRPESTRTCPSRSPWPSGGIATGLRAPTRFPHRWTTQPPRGCPRDRRWAVPRCRRHRARRNRGRLASRTVIASLRADRIARNR